VNPPADIVTARQLWWGVIGLGVVGLFVSLVDTLLNRQRFGAEFQERMQAADTNLAPATVDLLVTMGAVLGAVFGSVIAALGVLVVHQLGKGKVWARTLLTFVGIWLVIMGVASLFSIGAVEDTGPLVSGAASIVQAVMAAGAIYLCQRPESVQWFTPRPPGDPGKP
jgi:drug/metabolite transporter (DMT)-like permease